MKRNEWTAIRANLFKRRWITTSKGFIPAALLALLAVAIWQIVVVAADVPAYIVPSPAEIMAELLAESSWLAADLGWTMLEAVLGFLIGSCTAFITAVLFVHVRVVERAAFPWAIVLQTIPIVAIAPLLTIWFGYTLVPKVIIAAIICFFPVLVNTTRGLRAVSNQAMELMNVLSARKASIFWRLRLPSSLPYVFAGLRVAATLSVIGSIVAEFTGADRGIGYVIVQASYRIDTRLMFAAIALSSLAGIVFFHVIGWIEKATLRWPEARLDED
ncbi:MAG: ABC transporter permease [bacterium]|nr:ABC transporter permease [bacterium]MDE0500576.1 ABC transporter permease [bacterium]